MTKQVHVYALLTFVFCTCCKAPNKTELPPPKDTINASTPSPEVIGTPPPLVSHPTPVNELAEELEEALANNHPSLLVGQVIRSIFQDSKGNLWFGTLGDGMLDMMEKL